MATKKIYTKIKEYFKTTIIYEIISEGHKFIKNHPKIISAVIIMIFAVGIATYPIIDKTMNNSGTTDASSQPPSKNQLEQHIYVTVTGEVASPGMYEMTSDERINDAIRKAGGFTENAYTENINLAQKLQDGQYINVISKEHSEGTNSVSESKSPSEFYGIVNINTASVEELCQLPGIGEATALKIIEYRESAGRFEDIRDIQNVKGIGQAKYDKIKNNITI